MTDRGRPVKYTPDKIKEIKKKMDEYIQSAKIPILSEFAYMVGIPRQYLYEIEDLSDSIKLMMERKQAVLESNALTGKFNASMAIFSLKEY